MDRSMDEIMAMLKEAGSTIVPFKWEDGCFLLLDQRLLPLDEKWLPCKNWRDCARAIADMVVRGAPAIGITAAFGMALAAKEYEMQEKKGGMECIEDAGRQMKGARPTAVNLSWAVDRMLECLHRGVTQGKGPFECAIDEAFAIWKEDVLSNIRIGELGGALLPDEGGVLTHCNAGALATGGYGTALGVIRGAIRQGKKITVYADETRPWLQGARLTAWELMQDGIDVTINVDNASGLLMCLGKVKAVVVGADRIAANGDVANKIGTYNCAVAAKENSIDFHVAAPNSTFDRLCETGDEIPIEKRDEQEVLSWAGARISPENARAFNPVFDITPNHLITSIITEKGVLTAPYVNSIRDIIFSGSN